jgi:AraC family transcriptional regulator
MSEFTVHSLLKTSSVTVRDVYCQGRCRHKSAEECASAIHLVFPYRGAYVRHLGRDEAVAEASQVLFFNALEGYRVSHPIAGGDATLDLLVNEALLRELAPKALLRGSAALAFREQRLRIDPRGQVLAALLRHSLHQGTAEPLEAESLALTLVQRALGPRTTHAPGASVGRQRLVDRVKLVVAGDLSRRWALTDIAAEVGCSAVYLTQVFQQVEGVPLYRLPRPEAALRCRARGLARDCGRRTSFDCPESLRGGAFGPVEAYKLPLEGQRSNVRGDSLRHRIRVQLPSAPDD